MRALLRSASMVILVERGRAMIATRPDKAFIASLLGEFGCAKWLRSPNRSRRNSYDQRQWYASRGGPSAPAERVGAIYQGPVVRKPERAGLVGPATAAAGNQYPDQR